MWYMIFSMMFHLSYLFFSTSALVVLDASIQVTITIPKNTESIPTVWYQYLLLDLLYTSNNKLIIFTKAL